MDAAHFDSLTRILASSSRRQTLRLISGLGLTVWLDHDDTAAKKRKKKHKKKRQGPSPSSPPIAGGCPSGQKPCDGSCIASTQCCDNADCPISGQVCSTDRQCACPAALPEVCGGACVAPCGNASQMRDLESATCRCCTRSGYPANGDATSCCARRIVNDTCYGRGPDSVCTYDEQCESEYCFNGRCGRCAPSFTYCNSTGLTCGAGGGCLVAVDGTPRCGIPEDNNESDCGWCTRDYDCDQGQRPGYFCAVDTGPNCNCPAGQTFCAAPA